MGATRSGERVGPARGGAVDGVYRKGRGGGGLGGSGCGVAGGIHVGERPVCEPGRRVLGRGRGEEESAAVRERLLGGTGEGDGAGPEYFWG